MTTHKAILISLDRVQPMLLPEQTLWHDVNNILATPVTITDLRSALQTLELNRRVISHHDDLNSQTRYRITALGTTDLAAT